MNKTKTIDLSQLVDTLTSEVIAEHNRTVPKEYHIQEDLTVQVPENWQIVHGIIMGIGIGISLTIAKHRANHEQEI